MAFKLKGSVEIGLKEYARLVEKLHKINKNSEFVIRRTTSDFKSRAPSWVASAVSETYGIKKSEITKAKTGAKPVGYIRVAGIQIDNVRLTFSGRVLTPIHFKMKPRTRPSPKKDSSGRTTKKAKKYNVSAEIFKGQRKGLGPNIFLGTNKGSGQIPFKRTGKGRTPIEAIKTVSIPQMIGNTTVNAQVQKSIDENLTKRLMHHMNSILDKQG